MTEFDQNAPGNKGIPKPREGYEQRKVNLNRYDELGKGWNPRIIDNKEFRTGEHILYERKTKKRTKNNYQGCASLTGDEISKVSKLLKNPSGDLSKVKNSLTSKVNKAAIVPINAYKTIITSGESVKVGLPANTKETGEQSNAAYNTALGYVVLGLPTDNVAVGIINAWATTNIPYGDPITNAALIPMIQAYDLLRQSGKFSSEEVLTIDTWLNEIVDRTKEVQKEAVNKNSGKNNHQSWALCVVGLIGAVTNNDENVRYAAEGLKFQVTNGLQSYSGEPKYLGLDYHERKALHYVAYNLEAILTLSTLVDRAGLRLDKSSNIFNTVAAIVPYGTGELVKTDEFSGSINKDDAKRITNGALTTIFDPTDCLPVLELYSYFDNVYNSAINTIVKNSGKSLVSTTYPTLNNFFSDFKRRK